LVTGADGRLGYPTSLRVLQAGADLIISCRNATKCAATRSKLLAEFPQGEVEQLIIDFRFGSWILPVLNPSPSKRDHVMCFVQLFREHQTRCSENGRQKEIASSGETCSTHLSNQSFVSKHYAQVLVNNAGAIDNKMTQDGFVATMQINLFGPALFTRLLQQNGLLKPDKHGKARVINVGSASGYGPVMFANGSLAFYQSPSSLIDWSRDNSVLDAGSFYAVSKFAIPQYTAWQAQTESQNTVYFTVAPGFSRDPPSGLHFLIFVSFSKDVFISCHHVSGTPCIPEILFRPCPQYPSQGATGIAFAAMQPGIESASGANIDYLTVYPKGYNQSVPWTQASPSCVPRPLPGWLGKGAGPMFWDDEQRSAFFEQVTQIISQ